MYFGNIFRIIGVENGAVSVNNHVPVADFIVFC